MISDTPTQVQTNPLNYFTVVLGEAGTGKTTFLSQIPGHYFALTEPGHTGLSVYGSLINDWNEFLTLCKELVARKTEGKGRVIDVLCVDTYDGLYKLAGEHVAANTTFLEQGKPVKASRIDDIAFGKGFARTNELVLGVLKRLRLAGINVFVACHAKGKVEKYRGQDITVYGPALTPSASTALVDAADVVMYFRTEENVVRNQDGLLVANSSTRFSYLHGQFTLTAKHRLSGLPEKFELKRDTQWKDYTDLFNKALQTNKN